MLKICYNTYSMNHPGGVPMVHLNTHHMASVAKNSVST